MDKQLPGMDRKKGTIRESQTTENDSWTSLRNNKNDDGKILFHIEEKTQSANWSWPICNSLQPKKVNKHRKYGVFTPKSREIQLEDLVDLPGIILIILKQY